MLQLCLKSAFLLSVGGPKSTQVDPRHRLPYVAAFATGRVSMFTFLLVVHAIIAALLVTVILMQRSEGGGLTTGGSPSGLMSARGAADFLTRATAILATLFILMSILLAFIAATRHSTTIDTSLQRTPTAPVTSPTSAPAAPFTLGNTTAPAGSAPANATAPANSSVPLAQ
jgi:preprotein translocase subunit SecG